ncbi:hypothetical protein REPUB_Repub04eG0161100 [Reevesia pubescens]
MMVSYQYERFLDFYYVCGKLDHHESKCDAAVIMKKMNGSVSCEYEAWLRAETQLISPLKTDGINSNLDWSNYTTRSISGHSRTVGTRLDSCWMVKDVGESTEGSRRYVRKGNKVAETRFYSGVILDNNHGVLHGTRAQIMKRNQLQDDAIDTNNVGNKYQGQLSNEGVHI